MGVKTQGSAVVHVCTRADLDYSNWPGVISYDDRGRAWKDGRSYDPELDGLASWDLEAMSIKLDGDPEVCGVCGEPGEEICRDCRGGK